MLIGGRGGEGNVKKKKSLQILDFQMLASLDYVLQQVQTLSLL